MNILVSSTRQWNSGDEFILIGVRNLFRDLYKNHTFNWVLYDRNPDLFLDGYNQPIHRKNLFGNSFHHYNSKCIDIAVIAGTPEWFGSPLLNFYHAVKQSHLPLFLLGVGYIDAPITFSEEEQYCFKNFLKTAIARDEYASRALTSIGIQHQILPCPALFASKKERAVTKLEKIAFIIQTDKTICQSIPAALIHRSILEIRKLRNDGFKVDVICHHVDEFVDFARKLAPVRYSFDSSDYLEMLSHYDLAISTRLHGAILANSLGKPAIMINTTDTRCKGASSLFPFIYTTDLNNLSATINNIEISTLERLIEWKHEIEHKYLDILQNNFSEIGRIDRKKLHKKKFLNLAKDAKQWAIQKPLIAIGLIEHMGDIVACEPVSRYLRNKNPDAYILWAVREPYSELIENNPHIDETLVVHCLTEWISLSDSGIFDEVIDLHVNKRICPVCKIPLQKKHGNLDITVENYYNYGSLLAAFCQGAGLPILNEPPKVYISDSVVQTVNDLNLPNEYITFNCFTNEVSRDWQNSKWVTLAEQILEKYNIAIVEVGLESALTNNQNTAHLNLCGKLSQLETAEVIRRSILFVGVDSGPAHLANAVGTFGIVLLGHYRSFRHYLPYSGHYADGTNAELIYNKVGAASDIIVDDVVTALSKQLSVLQEKDNTRFEMKQITPKLTCDATKPTETGVSYEPHIETTLNKDLSGTEIKKDKKTVRAIAFYLPQFHPIPENDEWWGKGFTEWTNVAKAQPLFPGHYQPHIPADLGFYDLRLPEVRKAQADMAKEYGIYGFCYYHYWFNGRRLLNLPLDEVLSSGQPDFPFCLCWANEDWTRAWDGRSGEILMKQDYSIEDDLQHIRYLCSVFCDKRYIRINEKPLFLVYMANKLPDALKTTNFWREEARKLGIGELYLCRVESFPDEHTDPYSLGFDAAVEFQPDWKHIWPNISDSTYGNNTVFRYEDILERMLNKNKPDYKRFPCVTPSWDSTPRSKESALIFLDSNPVLYEKWLREIIKRVKRNNQLNEKIIFINAWNEWGEGNYLEPDLKFGRAYLEATRNALMIEIPKSIAVTEKSTIHLQLKPDKYRKAISNIKRIQAQFLVKKVSSHEEFKQYFSEMQDDHNRRHQFEKSLLKDSNPFNLGGYCYPCKKRVQFLVDYQYASEIDGVLTPNWRERLVCPSCGLNNRMRSAIHLFHKLLKPDKKSHIYLTEQRTPLFKWFSENFAEVIGSEFLGDQVAPGQTNEAGIRNEDLTHLSFSDNQFDFILSFDVLEHIPDYKTALKECLRVLKPKGAMLFTVPFAFTEKNIVRAVKKNDGTIEYLMTPDIHGDPNTSEGCLCYFYFGWELLDHMREIGYADASAYIYWSKKFGYLGKYQILFVGRKSDKKIIASTAAIGKSKIAHNRQIADHLDSPEIAAVKKLAIAYYGAGRFKDAFQEYLKILEDCPRDIDTLRELAHLTTILDRFDGCRQILQED